MNKNHYLLRFREPEAARKTEDMTIGARREKAKALHEQGLSLIQIANRLNISHEQARLDIRKARPVPKRDYLEMDGEFYLTFEQAREWLEYNGARVVERTNQGVLRWRLGTRGTTWYGCDPVFISCVGWRYPMSEVE